MLETPIEPWEDDEGAVEDSTSFAGDDAAADSEGELGQGAEVPATAGRRLQQGTPTGRWRTHKDASGY